MSYAPSVSSYILTYIHTYIHTYMMYGIFHGQLFTLSTALDIGPVASSQMVDQLLLVGSTANITVSFEVSELLAVC